MCTKIPKHDSTAFNRSEIVHLFIPIFLTDFIQNVPSFYFLKWTHKKWLQIKPNSKLTSHINGYAVYSVVKYSALYSIAMSSQCLSLSCSY